MTQQVVLAVDMTKYPEGFVLEDIVIHRQLSYFSEQDDISGLIGYFRDEPRAQYFAMVADLFDENNPREPFNAREDLEPDFKDLITRIMKVNPRQRMTAEEALAHRWFAEVP